MRRYQPSDHEALYDICRRTGDRGGDATQLYADPRLLGHVYVGPYLALAPQWAFVLDDGAGAPAGYAVGVPDTAGFAAACEQHWWPPLRRRYPAPTGPADRHTPDQRLARLIHDPPTAPDWVLARYPAHLHINLLPPAQGQGRGRALIGTLLPALAQAGAAGIYLGVAVDNHRAIGFYRRVGFESLDDGLFARLLP
ncbi:GNAT family N-acetyltransferase [Natronosporangium hydrolyticum]|uniref:GNAT family N-acetyltransferase n=1 Tax=Natronosporangium hydrolyticum TaxID=2811111 RepID=A0A895YT21_9ACTN|nr:GNAT family N-acetyltransferase [Natronosporangium hydrolyticum]